MSGSCGILHRVPILRGWTSGFSVGVALVLSAPLRCHSFRKCMRSLQDRGRHLSLPETNLVAPPPSPPSMVGQLWGTRAFPRWSGLWPCNCVQQPLPPCGVTRLPSRACKYSSGLTGSAYRACGEAASALHAMALLQVHQAKALKDLHEGGHDLTVLHELRAVTDLALRATKVTAQSLGRAMSTLVVQERHLWLCLADMKEQEKVQFLNAPMSQTGLFGDAVESFAQQFSAAQKQTEAIKHIMRRRKPAASTPAAAPQPARRRGRPSAAAPAQPQQPSTRQHRGAGRRQDAQPVQAPAKPGGKRRCKRP